MARSTPQRLPVQLYNGVRRLGWRLGRPPRFEEDALLEAARERTGLDDFGDDAFREGLGVLLRAYEEEADLTPFGRFMVAQQLNGVLQARLRVQDAWRRDPELRKAPVRRPIFILGLPRSGTTALHHLLAEDPAHQVLEYWLAGAPGPRPSRTEWQADPRYKAALQGLRLMYWLDPGLKAIHEMTADGPEECRHLLQQTFTDDTFDSNATIPSYTAWYRERDMRPSYAQHRDVLRLVQATSPQKTWVLKYPAHMSHLHVVLETYPDACIVQTHRDPTRVLPSLCSLVTGWRGIYEGAVDVRAVAGWQVEMWAERMSHATQVRDGRDPAQFFDLHFAELLDDPVAAVARLYVHFGLSLGAEAEGRMRDWLARHPQGRHGGHHYNAEEFGLVPEQMAERFAAYSERFGVAREG